MITSSSKNFLFRISKYNFGKYQINLGSFNSFVLEYPGDLPTETNTYIKIMSEFLKNKSKPYLFAKKTIELADEITTKLSEENTFKFFDSLKMIGKNFI